MSSTPVFYACCWCSIFLGFGSALNEQQEQGVGGCLWATVCYLGLCCEECLVCFPPGFMDISGECSFLVFHRG